MPQYLIHFPMAGNNVSELMIAGYQKYLEGDTIGLTNATQETKNVMNQYGQSGLQIYGHSRGAMTAGNAMESIQNQPNVQDSLSGTTINFYGPAFNAAQADSILSGLQNRDAVADPSQKNNMVLNLANHIADPVGKFIGGNLATGGTIPDGTDHIKEKLRAATGQPITTHNCYGGGSDACRKFWEDQPNQIPVLQPVRKY